MKTMQMKIFLMALVLLVFGVNSNAQNKTWSLDDCIDYALSKNIDIRKSILSTQENEVNLDQSKASLLPSLSGSVNKNFSWNKERNTETNKYGDLNGSNSTSYGLSSGVTLFNGFKMKTQIEQAKLNLESGQYYSESVRESVELNILNAYLQILYAQENVNNAREQITSTSEQLTLAEERLAVGIISRSDYLQIKSELASEKLTLADSKSTLAIARVNLMQLMELPLDDHFEIVSPDMSDLLEVKEKPVSNEVYLQALEIKPQIKQVALTLESVSLNEKIAKADLFPTLSLSAGLSTGWSSQLDGFNYTQQLKNEVTPTIGLSLSVPIFQNKQARNNIKLARIAVSDARLDETDTRNELRKDIEQAVVDVVTARTQFEASQEQYESAHESYLVASEKYEQGLLNSVDFLSIKTDMITSESDLLQAKYNVIFSNKILDFYKGIPISLGTATGTRP